MKTLQSVFFIWVLFSSVTVRAADYFVATNGNDGADGLSLSTPFRTIQKAADVALQGSTVSIRSGVYREQVELPRSGVDGAPIVFQSYNDEKVQLTTTEVLTGWSQHSGAVYRATFDSALRSRKEMTVFVEGQWIHEANWTDKADTADLLDRDTFATYEGGTRTSIYDSDLVDFPDDYWNGAIIWVQSHNWAIEAHRITDFDGATGTIAFDGSLAYDPQAGFEYLILDSLHALDSPGEWYFDEDANELYLWVAGGGKPDDALVEVKQRDECFDLNGNDYIHFVGLDMQGGDLDMADADHILLKGAHIYIPDRRFGPESGGTARGLIVDGDDNVIRECEFESCWLQSISLSGACNSIVNNYFHDSGFGNNSGSCVTMSSCEEGNLISHNSFTRVGRGAITGTGYRFIIQYNDFSNNGLLTEDVGIIAFGNNSYNNSIIHHNVFHDIDGYITTGVYVDGYGSDLLVHHNISYDIPFEGMHYNLPAVFLLIYNNTCFNSGKITAWSASDNTDATGSRLVNNIYSSFDSRLLTSGTVITGNLETTSSTHFEDAASGDFRLQSDSAALDLGIEIPGITEGYAGAAPDAGALELGEEMWVYGHDFANPPNPVYDWQPVAFMNLVENSGFEKTFSPWISLAGSPARINANVWNYRNDALGITGSGALELNTGDEIEQVITGLRPDTIYECYSKARLLRDIQVEDYDAKSGEFSSGSYRGETWLGDLNSGEWLCFDNVDFGAVTALFNRVEIGQQWDSLIDVELRLDDPVSGPLLSTITLPGSDNLWAMARADIVSVTGTHDLYLVFLGDGADNAMIDRIRFLDTNTKESVLLSLSEFDQSGDLLVRSGDAYWPESTRKIIFKTGPTNTSARLSIKKTDGQLDAYIDQVVLTDSTIVSVEQSAFTEHTLPCRIEAEAYDFGANGVAYYDDSEGNADGDFREDDVDIRTANGVNFISSCSEGEWLEYSISAPAGVYNIAASMSAVATGDTFAIHLKDRLLANIAFPADGNRQEFNTITVSNVVIEAGTNMVLRVDVTTGQSYLDWVEFELVQSIEPPERPTAIEVLQQYVGQLELSWQDRSENENSFVIQRRTDSEEWADLVTVSSNSTHYSDRALENSTATFFYRIKAVNEAGSSAYSTVASVEYQLVPMPASLVAYYNFDEGQGTIASDTALQNGAQDATANQIAPAWDASPLIGKSGLALDGTMSLQVEDALGEGTTAFSMSMWFNPGTSNGNYEGLFMSRPENWGIAYESGAPHVDYRTDHHPGGGSTGIDSPGDSATPGQWHHAVLTWSSNGSFSETKAYLNGELVASLNSSQNPSMAKIYTGHLSTWNIGDDPGTVAREIQARIDDLAIFNSVLSPERIARIHQEGLAGRSMLNAFAPFPVTGFAINPGGISISWDSGNGAASYQLLTTTNLALPLDQWTTLESAIPTTGDQTSFTLPLSPTDHARFYMLTE